MLYTEARAAHQNLIQASHGYGEGILKINLFYRQSIRFTNNQCIYQIINMVYRQSMYFTEYQYISQNKIYLTEKTITDNQNILLNVNKCYR